MSADNSAECKIAGPLEVGHTYPISTQKAGVFDVDVRKAEPQVNIGSSDSGKCFILSAIADMVRDQDPLNNTHVVSGYCNRTGCQVYIIAAIKKTS